jgi:hypothetical protein
MKMIDKDWLERITIAYRVYTEQVGPNLQIENFIDWLYQQYGIVQNKK